MNIESIYIEFQKYLAISLTSEQMVQFQDSQTLKYIQTQACPLLEAK